MDITAADTPVSITLHPITWVAITTATVLLITANIITAHPNIAHLRGPIAPHPLHISMYLTETKVDHPLVTPNSPPEIPTLPAFQQTDRPVDPHLKRARHHRHNAMFLSVAHLVAKHPTTRMEDPRPKPLLRETDRPQKHALLPVVRLGRQARLPTNTAPLAGAIPEARNIRFIGIADNASVAYSLGKLEVG